MHQPRPHRVVPCLFFEHALGDAVMSEGQWMDMIAAMEFDAPHERERWDAWCDVVEEIQ